MRVQLVILILLAGLTGITQRVIDVGKNDFSITQGLFYTVGGVPVSNTKYVKLVDGSPYFNDSWMRGRLAMGNNNLYDSLRLRLDLLENELQYVSPDGKELIATSPVRGITLTDSVTGKQYHFVHSSFLKIPKSMDHAWYQLIAAGTATLYKRIVKTITENKPYGLATVEQTIKTSDQYFLYLNNVFSRIKKIKDLPELLKEKKTEMTDYVRNVEGNTSEDFYNAVFYYNKLVEK